MSEHHDASGKFKKGNKASAGISKGKTGRPKKSREQRYHEILLRACTYSDWRKIVKKAVEQAVAGDKDARKWLAEYSIGKPPQKQIIEGDIGLTMIPLDWGDEEDSG